MQTYKLSDLKPINLEQEKQKFFSSNTYNPQFKYKKDIDITLLDYENFIPDKNKIIYAKTIIEKYRNQNVKEIKSQTFLSKQKVIYITKKFLEQNNIKDLVDFEFKKINSRALLKNKKHLIFRDPPKFKSKASLLSSLYHEIGTHFFRHYNHSLHDLTIDQKKLLNKNITKLDILKTSEGIAVINATLIKENKLFLYSSIYFLGYFKALKSDFRQTYNFIFSILKNRDISFKLATRLKRGLTDTSKPWAFKKDTVYFEGICEVYNFLKNNDFNMSLLYVGKVSIKNYKILWSFDPNFKPKLPTFIKQANYKQELKNIFKLNFEDNLL